MMMFINSPRVFASPPAMHAWLHAPLCCCTPIGASLVYKARTKHHPISQLLCVPSNHRVAIAKAAESSRAADGVQAEQHEAEQQERVLPYTLLDEYRALLDTVVDEEEAPPGFLLHAAVVIARHRHPTLDEDAIHEELDRLAGVVRDQLEGDGPHYPLHLCRVISRVLYEQEGFTGAHQSYYDPDNSCLNKVCG